MFGHRGSRHAPASIYSLGLWGTALMENILIGEWA